MISGVQSKEWPGIWQILGPTQHVYACLKQEDEGTVCSRLCKNSKLSTSRYKLIILQINLIL